MSTERDIADLRKMVASLRRTVDDLQQRVPANAGRQLAQFTAFVLTQTAHGFAKKDVVRNNGASWTKSKADTAANAVVGGIVITVLSADACIIATGGRITGLSGLTAGQVYYLDDTTAGGLVTTAPALAVPVIHADSATSGIILTPSATVSEVGFLLGSNSQWTEVSTGTSITTTGRKYMMVALTGGGGDKGSNSGLLGGGGGGGGGSIVAMLSVSGLTSVTYALGAAGNAGLSGGNSTITIGGVTLRADGGKAGGTSLGFGLPGYGGQGGGFLLPSTGSGIGSRVYFCHGLVGYPGLDGRVATSGGAPGWQYGNGGNSAVSASFGTGGGFAGGLAATGGSLSYALF